MKLKDKVVIVTGSSRGIGAAIALGMASEGAHVVVNYNRDDEGARKICRDIEEMGQQALLMQGDVSRAGSVARLVEQTLKRFDRIDILVNNAGIFVSSPMEDVTEEDWDRIMAVNLKSVFLCSQAVARHMIASKSGGAIINIASISAHLPEVNGGAYTPSKAAVIGLTRLQAIEWAKYNIRVNAISPGPVMTPLQRKAYHSQELLEARNRAIPVKRHGRPEEIAAAAVFLASDDASYITGEEITIDGGSRISMFQLVHQLANRM
ncbi:MAG: 3-oxoacyl-ACP reductase FabG [Deltaproteobacteria bacterium]|nr:3-oxoacyl-ACP reductase FabG [Deltaproteobacteria bacterium]MBW2081883.1 3-oxoacyl-ACP reductase FabG [Deltaproteobacteria bacterium]HDM09956.1 3-oxoacyl-ACP reductase FabG [Desulfobacteraceae bacterium]